MTRNLVICVVPTILALVAVYWLKRRKKAKPIPEVCSESVEIEENKTSLECTSSDLDNTLSDASSFTSPRSSEKSSETDSPLFDSPLHIADNNTHGDLILPNCIENSVSYANEGKDFLRIEDLTSSILTDSNQGFETESLKDAEILQSSDLVEQNADFFKSEDLFLSIAKDDDNDQSTNDQSTNDQSKAFCNSVEVKNNNSENCLEKKIADLENLDNYSSLLSVVESDKIIENDCQSSAYDENSLSYVSDDSEGKQLAEYKNKGSLSSVLDENSLWSSLCDELEKSSTSDSPVADLSKSNPIEENGLDSSKDVLDLLPYTESKINIQNYTDSYKSKVSDLDKLIKESSFQNEQESLNSEAFNDSSKEDLEVESPNLSSFDQEGNKETVDILDNNDLVQNNLSDVKKSVVISNDTKNLNIDGAFENEAEQLTSLGGSETYSDAARHSLENGHNLMSNFSGNKISASPVTYASILNSNRNNSSSDTDTNVVRRTSSEFASNCNDSVAELFKSNLNWPLPNSKSETSRESQAELETAASNRTFNTPRNDILPSKKYSEIKTNSSFTAADKSSSSSHPKNSLLESSCDEGHKAVVKHNKLESNGFYDQKTTSKDYVYEFELPQELCGRLIGKHGRNVKSIMEQSSANVFIKHHPYDHQLKIVVVEGERTDVTEALEIIRRKYPPSMFPAVTLVQTNLLSSTGVPMPESLQLHLPEGASCDVILSSLVSAGHFFLQQPTHPTYPSLSTLDQCMINLYSQVDTPLLPQPIEAGVICSAPVYRGWYRAQVVYVCDNSSDCGIKFVDYGGFSQVPISSLRQIRSDFMSLPFQASECYLAQVRPSGGDTWSAEATSVFEELAQGQILQALLVEYADDGIPCVYLYRVQGVSSTFINKELVDRGFAEWVGNSGHWDPH